MKKRIVNFLGFIVIVEMILGGLGNIFYLPIRKGIFLFTLIFFFYFILTERRKVNKRYIINIIWVGIFIFYGVAVGLVYKNDIGEIISTCNVFLGILYLIILSIYLDDDVIKIKKVINLIVNLIVILSMVTLIIFIASRFFMPSYWQFVNNIIELNLKLNYGLITGGLYSYNYVRVYFFNGIYMQLGLVLLIFRVTDDENSNFKTDMIKLIVVSMAILASGTRGYWLGSCIVIAISFVYLMANIKNVKIKIKPLIIILSLIIIVLLIFPKTINNKSIINIIKGESGIVYGQGIEVDTQSRIESITDFKNDPSNSVRSIQFKFLSNKIKQKPIFGWGFGATIPEYVDYMKSNNLQQVSASSFELYYIELLFKTGIIGIALILLYLITRLVQLIKLLRFLTKDEKNMLVSFTIGFVSCIASSFTNPYFAGLTGFFIIVLEIYIFETFRIKYLS
ncbi:O-antigen ligase family protein [Clostridium intestinale]|uniref:O-antigen ligase family protein n=1 Tax=Clostridium intestinale TaxID=36845 RepID=A0A7D6VRD0_9CLOT|nr:O-antigen ligase family protein [Clostridium intestinale]QLY79137.1 O-antigen ligase family protein [Clostridium intestinale]